MEHDFNNIEDSYHWVSCQNQWCNSAYLCLKTGNVYWVSDMGDSEDDLPDDLEESDDYILIPHKYDLDLGTELVFKFIRSAAPNLFEEVANAFSRKGAYQRYKSLLLRHNLLDAWRRFEEAQTQAALREWCAANVVELDDTPLDQQERPAP